MKFFLHRSGDTFHGSLYIVRGGVSLGTVETCSPQDLRQEWTFRLSFRVVVCGAISTLIAAEHLGSEVVFWFVARVHDHSPLPIPLRRC